MPSFKERLQDLSKQVTEASTKLEGAGAASPALRAVVAEFRSKAQKSAEESHSGPDQSTLHDSIIELEEAADSAKAAAEAESQLDEASREAIVRAHDEASALKTELLQTHSPRGERSPAQENL
jgi:uncharacterized coiled-coil DUF342 family protein